MSEHIRQVDLQAVWERVNELEAEVKALLSWAQGDIATGQIGAEDRLQKVEEGVLEIKTSLENLTSALTEREQGEAVRLAQDKILRRLIYALIALLTADNAGELWTLVRSLL